MTMIAIAFPILPGKTEEWRQWMKELNAPPRKEEFDASRERHGVRERTYLQETPQGDVVLVTLEGDDPTRALAEWPQETNEFTRWFIGKVIDLHGVDLRQPPSGPLPELVTQSPSLEERNEATVKGAYEAFGRQDVPAVLAAFDPQIEWTTPSELPFGGTVHGHEGVLGFFQSLTGYFAEHRVEPDHFVASDNKVIAIGHHRGATVDGEPFEIGFSMEWTFRNGTAIRLREYNDSGKLLSILAAGKGATAGVG